MRLFGRFKSLRQIINALTASILPVPALFQFPSFITLFALAVRFLFSPSIPYPHSEIILTRGYSLRASPQPPKR